VGGQCQLAVRKVTELTLAFDHQVCDGGKAGRRLASWPTPVACGDKWRHLAKLFYA